MESKTWNELINRIDTDSDIFLELFKPKIEVYWMNKDGEVIKTDEPLYKVEDFQSFGLSEEEVDKLNEIFWDLVLEKYRRQISENHEEV